MISTFKRNACHVAFGALAIAVLPSLAQAQAVKDPMQGGMAASAPMAMPSGGVDMKAMMKDMSGKMSSTPMSDDPDVDFAMMMRIHHQGAIDMANAELSGGKDPQMKKMAKAIITAQKKEIAQFDAYVSKHGRPAEKMSK